MAHSTKPPSAVRVKLAVHMRRCGSTWRAIGFELGCSSETVRQWPRIYPNEWQAAVREDVRQTADKADGQAAGAMMMMLQHGSERSRVQAARSLIQRRIRRGWEQIRSFPAEKPHRGWLDSALAILQERSHVELKFLGEVCLLATRGGLAEFGATGAAKHGLSAK